MNLRFLDGKLQVGQVFANPHIQIQWQDVPSFNTRKCEKCGLICHIQAHSQEIVCSVCKGK